MSAVSLKTLLSCAPLALAFACTPNAGGGSAAGTATGTGEGTGEGTGPATSTAAGSSESLDDTGGTTAADSDSSSGEAAVCGNGIVEPGEDCDRSGESATCNANCTTVVCGDGIANTAAGEDCDDSANGDNDDGCTDACLSPACGDGMTQISLGEQCDESGESWSCNEACMLKSWGEPSLLGPYTPGDGSPRIVVHGNGNAMAIWRTGSAIVRLAAARYDAASDKWGGLTLIDETVVGGFPEVAMDDNENVIVVWASEGAARNGYVARYDVATDTWSGAQLLETETGSVFQTSIAVTANGDATAVWAQADLMGNTPIYASRYAAATNSWGPRLQLTTGTRSDSPAVATDDSDNAIAVWRTLDGSWFSTYTSRYSVLAGDWSDPVALLGGGLQDTSQVGVAVEGSGNAIAVWSKSDGTRINLHAASYDAATDSWGDTELLENDDNDVATPLLAIDDNGDAIAVWTHLLNETGFSRAKHHDAQTGNWGPALTLCSGCTATGLAVSGSGNAAVTAIEIGGAEFSTLANRYNAGAGRWGGTEPLAANAGALGSPDVGITDNGNVVAAWTQADGADLTAVASVFD